MADSKMENPSQKNPKTIDVCHRANKRIRRQNKKKMHKLY